MFNIFLSDEFLHTFLFYFFIFLSSQWTSIEYYSLKVVRFFTLCLSNLFSFQSKSILSKISFQTFFFLLLNSSFASSPFFFLMWIIFESRMKLLFTFRFFCFLSYCWFGFYRFFLTLLLLYSIVLHNCKNCRHQAS